MFEQPQVQTFPVLPLRDIVVFPHMIVPLFVGRDKSVRALEDVMKDDKQILLVAQKDAGEDNPSTADIHDVGTVSTVLQLLKLPDGTVKVLVEGGSRAKIESFTDNQDFFQANARILTEEAQRSVPTQLEVEPALRRGVRPELLGDHQGQAVVAQHTQHFTALAPITAADHYDFVVFLDF